MNTMIIREALPEDRSEIAALCRRSQLATRVPNPDFYPPEELGDRLYARQAIGRYVVESSSGAIYAHGLIEQPSPEHLEQWSSRSDSDTTRFIELGGAFVEPTQSGKGIWSALLAHRLGVVRAMDATPVSVTWAHNLHVMRQFERVGGREVGQKATAMGALCLYRFEP